LRRHAPAQAATTSWTTVNCLPEARTTGTAMLMAAILSPRASQSGTATPTLVEASLRGNDQAVRVAALVDFLIDGLAEPIAK
jgi:hypothetical protein